MGKPAKPSNAAARPFLRPGVVANIVGGILLVFAGAYVGQRFEVGPHLDLDVRGTRVSGTAERLEDGEYRLSFKHPSGAIHATRYRGRLRLQGSSTTGDVELAYDPDQPGRFQPAGISYLPAAAAGFLFLAGMACVLRTRHLARSR